MGIGCVLPGAASPETFWTEALAGRVGFRPLTGGAWDWDRLGLGPLPPAGLVADFTPDWRAFRMPPADAAAMNPAQLYVLEAGRQAVANVATLPRDRTGVWLGATGLGWQPDTGMRVRLDALGDAVRSAGKQTGASPRAVEEALAAARATLEARLRPASEEPVVNSAGSIAAGRLAMLLDLRGPHCAVDAGFASGLAALDLAVRALRDGTVDCALVGAASELLSPAELVALSRMGVLATGCPRPFDVDAAGTLPGEGAVIFAAKRLDDALRDGDRIHAVVLGVAGACDGSAASPLAPRPDGLVLAMRRAQAEAGVDPATVGFLECHATGTPRGDVTELAAVAEGYRGVPGPVALGSAKAQVGHLRGAAGAVGLLRAVLALESGVVPPQARFSRPHPDLRLAGSAFSVPTAPLPLRALAGAGAPRAAVSALSLGGLAYHAVLEAHVAVRPRQARARAPGLAREPIAVVGLGAVLPGAADVAAFWRALVEGRSSIREVPASRWDAARYCDPDPARLERSYTRLGGFTDAPATADVRWHIPPSSLGSIDPAHLLVLRAAEEAVADAGLGAGTWDRARTGVFLGFMACQGKKLLAEVRFHFARLAAELERTLLAAGLPDAEARAVVAAARERVEAGLPPITEDSLPGWLGSVAAARIARRFDLRGPQLTVESACASTLAALQAAVHAVRDGTCDTALLGGVWADMQPEFYVGSCRFNALSATGSTPFDARANGFVPGEGAGLLVLRRLSAAERDGQRIHALVRSVGASSDGKGKSVFAPSLEGEALAMRRALDDGGVDPALVDYVECHGTGTALGDRVEIDACLSAYGRGRRRPLRVGSVKSNIGHLLGAAGAPALIKAVLAVREGLIPPSLAVERPNPAIDFSAGPVEVVTRAYAWEAPAGEPRRAGVSGFGLGGTNVHAIVEQYRPPAVARVEAGPAPAPRHPPVARASAPRALAIAAAGGDDAPDCLERLGRLATSLRDAPPEEYREALRATQRAAAGAPYRVAVVAADPVTLGAKVGLLARGLSGGIDPALLRKQGVYAAEAGRDALVAATFPGQGPQYPNMLREALGLFPSIGDTLEAADRAYEALCGRALRPSFFTDDPEVYAQSDEDIHCAVFAVNVALYRLLARRGLAPRALMGQSAGELAALVAARAMSFADGLAVVRERTLSVLALTGGDAGKMVALSCGADRGEHLARGLPGYAALAADNGPSACIVSGDSRAVPELLRRAAQEGVEASVLAVSHGYHSKLIEAARPRFLRLLRTIPFRAPEVEVISTVTGRSLSELPPERFPEHLASQFVEPVRLRPAVEALHARGVRVLVECGPKWSLTTFVGQILEGRPHVAHAMIHPKVGEAEQLQRALACLFVHGAAVLEEDHPMTDTPRSTPEVGRAPERTGEVAPARVDVVALLRGIRDLLSQVLDGAEACEPGEPRSPVRELRAAATAPDRARSDAAAAPVEAAPAWRAPATPAVPDGRSPRDPSPPTAVAPREAEAAPRPPARSRDELTRALVEEYARRTGYPEEMLDPELDLEAELGIDTVKQVAVLAAVRERLGLAPDPAFKLRDANTILKAVAWLAGRLEQGHGPAPAPVAAPRSSPAPRDAAAVEAVTRPPANDRSGATSPRASIDAAREQVRAALVDELVKRTGYPEEMLDLDLDLEAELGIDTVKQVAVLAAARERFGLAPDPAFKLRDANTIRKAVEALARRIAGTDPEGPGGGPRPPGGGAPRPRGAAAPSASAQGSVPAAVPAEPVAGASGRMLEALFGAAGDGDIREISGLEIRATGAPAPSREPLVDVAGASDGGLRLRAILGSSEVEASVRVGGAEAPPPAPAEILRAIAPERQDRASSGDELREALAPVLGAADGVLAWARSDGFMVAAGGATVPAGDDAHRLAALLACAGELAAFAWVGLTGAPHEVCSMEHARIHRLPAAGETIGVHAKMVAPESGLWRANVTVVAGRDVVAELRGVCGRPIASAAAAGPVGEAAERAWRRFCRRMQDGRASEGVA